MLYTLKDFYTGGHINWNKLKGSDACLLVMQLTAVYFFMSVTIYSSIPLDMSSCQVQLFNSVATPSTRLLQEEMALPVKYTSPVGMSLLLSWIRSAWGRDVLYFFIKKEFVLES